MKSWIAEMNPLLKVEVDHILPFLASGSNFELQGVQNQIDFVLIDALRILCKIFKPVICHLLADVETVGLD